MWNQAQDSPEESSTAPSNGKVSADNQDLLCGIKPTGNLNLNSKCFISLVAFGLLIGLLSGLFGVGGGFLIVPALLFITRMPMRNAIATSLLIIGFIGTSGFTSFVIANPSLDWALLSQICLGGLLGMLAGRLVVKYIAGIQLQRTFSVALIAMVAVTLTSGLS
tara:strand:- start:129 stop:620 length:492 start_codon:yes stop_codon:yes gene_type:complete